MSIHLVWVDKSGRELSAFVQPIRISMAKCVLSALMVKFGIQLKKNACAKMDTNGIVNIVKEHGTAQEIEFGMQHSSNAFAEITISGVVMHVYLSQHVRVDNIGMQSS